MRSPDTRGRFLNKQLSFAAEMGVLNLEHRTKVLRAEWVSSVSYTHLVRSTQTEKYSRYPRHRSYARPGVSSLKGLLT